MGVELEATVKDNFSPTIKKWNDELGHVADAVNGLNRSVDDQAKIMGSQAAAIAKNRDMLREMARAEEEAKNVKAASRDETQKMSDALGDSILKLKAQKDLLNDPVFTANLRRQQSLRAEINQMTSALTEVTGAHVAEKKAIEAGDEAVKLTVRSRRELIVLAHELSQGRYKNFGGSLMVLEEGQGGISGALKGAIAMMGGPYVAAAGAAALATAGVTYALWKASEAQAEMVHKSNLLGQTLGVSGEAIRGFGYLVAGTNVTTEDMGRVFGIFEKNLGKNSEKFRELGITAHDPMQAFEQVMDKARGMSDAIERANFLNEALGRGWEKAAPAIMKGGAAMAEAIEAMRIPEDVPKNYERANDAQIQIDQDFKRLSVSSGSFFASFRADAKEFEQSFFDMLAGVNSFEKEVQRHAKEAGLNAPIAGGASEEEKKKQTAAIAAANKRLAKNDIDQAIENVKAEWAGRLDAFKDGAEKWKKAQWTIGADPTGEYERAAKNYRIVFEAEQAAEEDVRKSFAKKNKEKAPKAAEESDWSKADSSFEKLTGGTYAAYVMTHDDGGVNSETDTSGRTPKWIAEHKKAADAQAKIDEQLMADVYKYADAYHKGMDALQDKETKKLQEENDKRLKAEQDYWRAMQSAAESSINSTLQTLIMGGGSMKSKLNALLTQGESSLISSGVSMLMGAAFAPATGGTSLAVPAGMEFLTSIMGVHRASGGHVMGSGFIGNEGMRGRGEWYQENTPGRIYNQTQQTTNNIGGAVIHIHAGGGNAQSIAREVAKILPRASNLSSANRSQTSRSGA